MDTLTAAASSSVAATKPDSPFYMAGTEKTGEYVVLAVTKRGRLGIRNLGDHGFRIRVEPNGRGNLARLRRRLTAEKLVRDDGWKQPGDNSQSRFSRVVFYADRASKFVAEALEAIGYQAFKYTRKLPKKGTLPAWAAAMFSAAITPQPAPAPEAGEGTSIN